MLEYQLVYKRKEKIREGKNIWQREWKKLRNMRAQSDSDTREKDSCRGIRTMVHWETSLFQPPILNKAPWGVRQHDSTAATRPHGCWSIHNNLKYFKQSATILIWQKTFSLHKWWKELRTTKKSPQWTHNTCRRNYIYPNTEQIHASSMLSPDTS